MKFPDCEHRKIEKNASWDCVLSVCCLVTDSSEYVRMREAFAARGFGEQLCEFLICDNRAGNEFSAFEAVRCFVREARGRYILIAHQDVRPLENAEKLLSRIGEVEAHDPTWGVIGNAGVGGDAGDGSARSIELPDERHELGKPFVRVRTIDENVMIIRNGAGINASADLAGFHLYAFDICSIARRLGFSCYVVDYMWRHESHGLIGTGFLDARQAMERKLYAAGPDRFEETMCTVLASRNSCDQFVSAVKALWMLRDDPKRRKDGHEILLRCSKERWAGFGGVYLCASLARAAFRKSRDATRCLTWRVRSAAKVTGWHAAWWRENWRSRIFPFKAESGEQKNSTRLQKTPLESTRP